MAIFFTPASTEAEIYASGSALQNIRELGLKVLITDGVTDGCWQSPKSTKNKAVAVLNQYRLYNSESSFTLHISANGFRTQSGIYAVGYDLTIWTIIPETGLLVFGSDGAVVTGRDSSDYMRSDVEHFIEELVATFAKSGL